MAGDEEHPQRVLVWDFDLEAPGLHRLFPPKRPQRYGFVDLVYEYAKTGDIPDVQDYIYESEVPGINVLPAGKMGELYCSKLQRINWVKFFGSDPKDPGPFFGKLLKTMKLIANPFDYVLIDSRTGLNDQAGICTQVISDLVIVLFRLTAQNLDGLEHLIPAIRSKLKARAKEETQILPVASQVQATSAQEQSLIREKSRKIFERELEYVRFDEGLVSKEKLFCLAGEIESMWPRPPIVDDYTRICGTIRAQNGDDTKTLARELRLRMQEGDTTTASTLLLRLLPRRPRLHRAWQALSDVFEYRIPKSRRQQFNRTVSKILRKDPENFFAHQWKAAFESSKAAAPESTELKKAKNSLKKAVKYAADSEKGNILRALACLESIEGNHENAINFLRRAQEMLAQNNQVNLDLAMLHMRMGAKYFAVAAEELDAIPSEIGDEKYLSLAYLRTFLGEPHKALNAFQSCDKSMRPLVKAHMLLIEGKRSEAIRLGEKHTSSREVSLGLANWGEFYICAGDFAKAISLAKRSSESRYDSKSDLERIKQLAGFLRRKDGATSREREQFVGDWGESSWCFRELLVFRECAKRDGKAYARALDIIERLIQFQELYQVTYQTLGLFKRGARFRKPYVKVRLSKG
jgi:cellulose biosynthesis protein BcsQ